MKRIFIVLLFILISENKISAAVPEFSARHACLMVQQTGDVIFEYNGHEKASMASTTKIMTALIAVEECAGDERVTVSDNAANQEGSSAYLSAGDEIAVNDLLYGLMLNSGNDAAVAIAEHISGNVEAFSVLMNQRAVATGALNTNFETPSGLDSDKHYSTAYDMALISSHALNNKMFREIVKTKSRKTEYSSGTLFFSNHNKLLKMYDGCTGVKTGFTKKSGRCLVSAAERDGIVLVCVTLDAPDDWNDHIKLLDYGFSVTKLKKVISRESVLKKIKTDSGIEIPVRCTEDVFVPGIVGRRSHYELDLHTIDEISGSVDKGEKIGEFTLVCGNKCIASGNLETGDSYIKKEVKGCKGIFVRIRDFIKALLCSVRNI